MVVTTLGCNDGGDERDAATADRIPISSVDYGTRATDLGDRRELNRLVNLYATLQRRFQAGDTTSVCDRVSPHLLKNFPHGSGRVQGPCEKRLTLYARRLRSRRQPRPTLNIDWVRTYDFLNIGGITATDDKGKALRVPFQRENGIWKLRLGVFARPDTLAGTLIP